MVTSFVRLLEQESQFTQTLNFDSIHSKSHCQAVEDLSHHIHVRELENACRERN